MMSGPPRPPENKKQRPSRTPTGTPCLPQQLIPTLLDEPLLLLGTQEAMTKLLGLGEETVNSGQVHVFLTQSYTDWQIFSRALCLAHYFTNYFF